MYIIALYYILGRGINPYITWFEDTYSKSRALNAKMVF